MRKKVLLAMCVFGIGASSQSADLIQPDPIENYVGLSWSGIRLGATKDSDLKKLFKLEKGAIRPEAVRLKVTDRDLFRVDALLDSRGAKATVIAIFLQYQPRRGPEIIALGKSLSLTPEIFYPPQRYEDWSMVTFEQRGITAFTLNRGDEMRADTIVLSTPEGAAFLSRGMDKSPSEIEVYDPKFSFEDLLIEFPSTSANINGSNVSSIDRGQIEEDICYELERGGRAKFLRYNRRGRGSVSASLDFSWSSKRKEVTYSVTVNGAGKNALGNVSASGSASRTVRHVDEKPRIRANRIILDLVRDAQYEMEREFDQRVSRQRPPTKEEIRWAEWLRLINDSTRR